jgi:DNA end-binding protein Ku
MRAIWSGTIAFGLISIPVKLYTAVGRTEKLEFHLLHEKDGERIHNQRVCEKGHKVEWDDLIRGYEYEKGKWVTFTDEELDALDTESMRTVDVVSFVGADEIDPIYFDSTYYVGPEASGMKAYKLLVDALEHEGLVGVAKVAIREREHLAAVRVADGEIVLHTMHWPDEIRARDFKKPNARVTLRDNEKKMARQLVQQLASDFEPEEFKDEYYKAVKAAVRKKIKGEEIVEPEGREEPAAVGDLMDALRASVEAVRKGKSPSELRKQAAKADPDDLNALSKDELLTLAEELDVPKRASMTKKQLVAAISKSRKAAA